jgi:hypothetical protein
MSFPAVIQPRRKKAGDWGEGVVPPPRRRRRGWTGGWERMERGLHGGWGRCRQCLGLGKKGGKRLRDRYPGARRATQCRPWEWGRQGGRGEQGFLVDATRRAGLEWEKNNGSGSGGWIPRKRRGSRRSIGRGSRTLPGDGEEGTTRAAGDQRGQRRGREAVG